jgi:hypothetical protein
VFAHASTVGKRTAELRESADEGVLRGRPAAAASECAHLLSATKGEVDRKGLRIIINPLAVLGRCSNPVV